MGLKEKKQPSVSEEASGSKEPQMKFITDNRKREDYTATRSARIAGRRDRVDRMRND